jgi:hypothetical protein
MSDYRKPTASAIKKAIPTTSPPYFKPLQNFKPAADKEGVKVSKAHLEAVLAWLKTNKPHPIFGEQPSLSSHPHIRFCQIRAYARTLAIHQLRGD